MSEEMRGTFLDNSDVELDIDYVELAMVLLKNRGVIIFSTLVFALAGFFAAAFLMEPVYTSNAMLMVNSGDRGNGFITSDQLSSSADLVETYGIIITSDSVKNVVKENLGMQDTYDSMVKYVGVTPVENTSIINISVDAWDPAVALAVCQEITKVCPDVIVKIAEAASANIVSEATCSDVPTSPSVKMFTVLGGGFGFVLACGIFVIKSLLNNKVIRESDIRQLGLTTMGVIPSFEGGEK